MRQPQEQAIVVAALRSAAPYIRLYKGKTFVIKAGGDVFADPAATRVLLEQVEVLYQVGIRIVFVHGGGPQLTRLAEELGVVTRIVHGRRVTDERSLEVTTMVLNGIINTRILAVCRDLELPAVGISGVDCGLIRAHKRPPVRLGDGDDVDFGYVGDIDAVDAAVVRSQLDQGLMPVVSPLSADAAGTLLNINADTVAAALAAELAAEKLILATGSPGILEDPRDPGSLLSYIDLARLERLRAAGQLGDGMLPKATAIEMAIRGGVRRVHVISHTAADALLLEVFTNEGTGTLIVADIGSLAPAEQKADP